MSDVETRYAKADGGYLAYHVLGDGPVDIVELPTPGQVSIDSVADEPHWERFDRRLSSFARLIRFDRRGIGLSDVLTPGVTFTLEQYVEDIVTVMDACGSERSALLGSSGGGFGAILCAATRPDRVSALILANTAACLIATPDYPIGRPADDFRAFFESLSDPGAGNLEQEDQDLAFMVPSLAADVRFRDWWRQAGRRGASPGRAREHNAAVVMRDLRSYLPKISAPTLVLHSAALLIERPHGRYLADNIAGARFVELFGEDTVVYGSAADEILMEIEEFLTGVRRERAAERVLATVLFTDIVGSTRRAAELGDRRWRELLDEHDRVAGERVEACGGRQIKLTGDGLLATFDSPARAIRCACALRDALAAIGLETTAGIHTGEVELRGDDIGGIAVHIASRVQAFAKPGEVLVSRTVTDLMVGSGIEFRDRGAHTLKGVPGRWRLFAVSQ